MKGPKVGRWEKRVWWLWPAIAGRPSGHHNCQTCLFWKVLTRCLASLTPPQSRRNASANHAGRMSRPVTSLVTANGQGVTDQSEQPCPFSTYTGLIPSTLVFPTQPKSGLCNVYRDDQSKCSFQHDVISRLFDTNHQNVEFLNNPARFLDPYHFRVTFECIAQLPEGHHTMHSFSPGNDQHLV